MQKTIQVSGMSCMHCKMRVEKALKNVPGVTNATVDLAKNNAVVEIDANVQDLALKNAVKEAGYKPGKIEG